MSCPKKSLVYHTGIKIKNYCLYSCWSKFNDDQFYDLFLRKCDAQRGILENKRIIKLREDFQDHGVQPLTDLQLVS